MLGVSTTAPVPIHVLSLTIRMNLAPAPATLSTKNPFDPCCNGIKHTLWVVGGQA